MIVLPVVLLALSWQSAGAALFFTDQFNYTDGQNLGAAGGGGAVWTLSGGDVSQIVVSSRATLAAPNGFADAAGRGVAVTPTGTRKATGVPFNGVTGIPVADGNVGYASFLLDVRVLPAANLRVAYLHTGAASSAGIEVVVSSTGQVGIQKKGSGTTFVSGTPVATQGTHLVVMRYKFQTGNDEVAVWVDPGTSSFGSETAPATGAFAATTGGGSDMSTAITYFMIESAAVTGPVFWIDEVRIGTTWADVTPTDGPSAPTPVPVITQALLSAQGLVLRGSNGPPNSLYQVLTSTNLTAITSNWPAVSTNAFDAIGHFDSTNPVMAGAAQQFFRLRVGGTTPPRPVAPAITNQPQSLTVAVGANANFLVGVSGTAPLNYVWSFNANSPVGGNSNTLTLLNVQTNQAGSYRVIVTNSMGSVTSSIATLTVQSSPVITTQPQSQTVAVSNSVTFTVTAAGAEPLAYQWFFNTNTPIGGNSNSYTLARALTNNAGVYSVRVTNNFGAVTSAFAPLNITTGSVNLTQFNLVGFGAPTVGGGQLAESNPGYRKVYTPGDLRLALDSSTVKVIEIMNDLNLGWNEIGVSNQVGDFSAATLPVMHPVLLASGVTTINLVDRNGLTIFSANGATLRHVEFNIKRTHNLLLRNLKFDELWEWDERSKGDYDRNDWDFITIGDAGPCTNVWIDHCDFTKAYDGVVDIKKGNNLVTISWCRFLADDGGPDSFVRRQIQYLETNGVAETMYDYLRSHGFSVEDIISVERSQKKGHLVGATDLTAANADINLTLHHNYYLNLQDRMPRLRAGNVHVFNIYVDDTQALADRRLKDARVAAGASTGSFSFGVTLNGSISTENGAVLVEKSVYNDCFWPLRNNQTDPSNPLYTGKIMALDSIYHFDNADGSTVDYRGNSTNAPGDTYFGPLQALPPIPFSWNTNAGMPAATLPYIVTPDDPAQLLPILQSGAGSGVLTWNKTNWLKTSY